jgi:hypothetical protein
VTSIAGARCQLICESGLADPWLAAQQKEAATATRRVVKPLKEFPELSLAADKDRPRSVFDHA